MIFFLKPKDSIERIGRLLPSLIKDGLQTNSCNALIILLLAHIKIVRHLNCGFADCDIPWNDATNFLSPSTLMADAKSFVSMFGDKLKKPEINAVLNSFNEWTEFSREKIDCACGKISMKLREVDARIMLRHIIKEMIDLEKSGSASIKIIFNQFIGIQSGDKRHLNCHYDTGHLSCIDKNISIVSETAVELKIENEKLILVMLEKVISEQFNLEEFNKRMMQIVKYSEKFLCE